jgi:hypothetical protein|tara:strand:+ start:282 stop:587 length:306 start_codon:yes stop_codon:yes gene_type:complete
MSDTDQINHPDHYNQGIETTDYICSWGMDFCEGNIVKYVTRYKLKGGLEDLRKAQWYLELLISQSENLEKSKHSYSKTKPKKSKQLLTEVARQMSKNKSKR